MLRRGQHQAGTLNKRCLDGPARARGGSAGVPRQRDRVPLTAGRAPAAAPGCSTQLASRTDAPNTAKSFSRRRAGPAPSAPTSPRFPARAPLRERGRGGALRQSGLGLPPPRTPSGGGRGGQGRCSAAPRRAPRPRPAPAPAARRAAGSAAGSAPSCPPTPGAPGRHVRAAGPAAEPVPGAAGPHRLRPPRRAVGSAALRSRAGSNKPPRPPAAPPWEPGAGRPEPARAAAGAERGAGAGTAEGGRHGGVEPGHGGAGRAGERAGPAPSQLHREGVGRRCPALRKVWAGGAEPRLPCSSRAGPGSAAGRAERGAPRCHCRGPARWVGRERGF